MGGATRCEEKEELLTRMMTHLLLRLYDRITDIIVSDFDVWDHFSLLHRILGVHHHCSGVRSHFTVDYGEQIHERETRSAAHFVDSCAAQLKCR